MTATHDPNSTTPTAPVLCFSLELGWNTWKLAFTIGAGQKPRLRTIHARDLEGLLGEIRAAKARFGLPEVKRALFPAGGGVQLGRRIPMAIALELGLTGDTIDAQRAFELGLVNRVVPPDQVLEEAVAFAERIAENGPLAVRVTKELMKVAVNRSREEAFQRQDEVQASVFGSEDAQEGARAFIEKRAPQWKGR